MAAKEGFRLPFESHRFARTRSADEETKSTIGALGRVCDTRSPPRADATDGSFAASGSLGPTFDGSSFPVAGCPLGYRLAQFIPCGSLPVSQGRFNLLQISTQPGESKFASFVAGHFGAKQMTARIVNSRCEDRL